MRRSTIQSHTLVNAVDNLRQGIGRETRTALRGKQGLLFVTHTDGLHVGSKFRLQTLVKQDSASFVSRAFRRQQPSNRPVLECLSVSCQLLSFIAAPRFLVLLGRQLL